MATVNAGRVWIGTPNQATTGAILDAPLGSTLPTDATTALDAAFASSGYVSDEGLSISTDYSTNDIKEWNGATVRKVLESFDGVLSWEEIEFTEESLKHAFGADNVTKTAATSTKGEQITVKIGAHLPAARAWVFQMKDGDAKIRVVVPNGQVTKLDEITFNASDPIKLPIELSCYPDSSGESIYIYTDDGVHTTSSSS